MEKSWDAHLDLPSGNQTWLENPQFHGWFPLKASSRFSMYRSHLIQPPSPSPIPKPHPQPPSPTPIPNPHPPSPSPIPPSPHPPTAPASTSCAMRRKSSGTTCPEASNKSQSSPAIPGSLCQYSKKTMAWWRLEHPKETLSKKKVTFLDSEFNSVWLIVWT